MASDRNPPTETDEGTGLAVPGGDMSEWAEALVAQARTDGVELTGEGGLLTGLIRQVLQTGLEVEMVDHLGYDRYAPEGRGSGNSRNGYSPKRVTTDIGEVELSVPRDRAGSFEPVTVPKYQRRLDGLSGNVISLYAKGLATGDIQAHLEEIYDTDISRETISRITDRIVDDMVSWQNRPLDPPGVVDRRDRDQSQGLAGGESARLCGYWRQPRRAEGCAGSVAGTFGWGGS
jgi:putative transposase